MIDAAGQKSREILCSSVPVRRCAVTLSCSDSVTGLLRPEFSQNFPHIFRTPQSISAMREIGKTATGANPMRVNRWDVGACDADDLTEAESPTE